MDIHSPLACARVLLIGRSFLARKKVWLLRADIAAVKIQALWRGVVERAEVDRAWLDARVILIQAQVKRFLARIHFVKDLRQANKAASQIQRVFRGSRVRQYSVLSCFLSDVLKGIWVVWVLCLPPSRVVCVVAHHCGVRMRVCAIDTVACVCVCVWTGTATA